MENDFQWQVLNIQTLKTKRKKFLISVNATKFFVFYIMSDYNHGILNHERTYVLSLYQIYQKWSMCNELLNSNFRLLQVLMENAVKGGGRVPVCKRVVLVSIAFFWVENQFIAVHYPPQH